MRDHRSNQYRQESHAVFRKLQARSRQLRSVRPVSKKALQPGVLVWAHVPFDDEALGKLRPAVVVRPVEQRCVVVRPITSKQSATAFRRAVPIVEWAAAGLDRASMVYRREVALPLADVVSTLGELRPGDRERALQPLSATPTAYGRRAA